MAKQCSALGLNWFQNARFGMFVHWGPISVAARHDWLMYGERLSARDYESIAYQFNPSKFNADEWVRTAADAGQKYIVYITRHHDGFSMYDTGLSDYKVTNTALRRDPLRELADAIAKRGDMKLGVYNSLLDWRHPAYRANNEAGCRGQTTSNFYMVRCANSAHSMANSRASGLMAIGPDKIGATTT